ncbi:putative transcription factor interactor and regulator CCHC(Zn) family [Helianthus annuus]|nr:putative transcription factor interactor and regulator CCHC(Zn) family [Helianthus annuus]
MEEKFYNALATPVDIVSAALLKKSFDMFVAFEDVTTKQTIDRYCHLVLEMGRLDIKKKDDEWVDKLAEALPQQKWGTYLLIVKHMRKSQDMNLAQFIQKVEEHELDIQKKAKVEESSTKEAKGQKAEKESDEPVTEKEVEKIVEVEKLVEVEKNVKVEKIVEKVVEVTKPCEKCSESCKDCDEKDKKIAELEKMKEDLLSDVKYVKESYDILNRTVDSLKRTNAEIEKANDKMSATLMTKQSVINDYIEDCANLKKELELERIESERINRLLLSYTTCDYLIDRVYPTVAGLEAFKKKEKEEDTGGSSEDEQKKPFWKQSNQEFLAEVKKNVRKFASRVDRRTCFKCQKVGHIAWNCQESIYSKQGVSSNSDMKKKCVDKSTLEVSETSKRFYKRQVDLSKQKWVVKSESNSDNESDSIKSEESLVDKKIVNSVPVVNDENFSSLSKENLMKKVGKVKISNQFFADKGEFDVEKAFNGKVKHILGRWLIRR